MTVPESDLHHLIESGLPRVADRSARVIVVGAGMAGLVCAELLTDAGHDVMVLEGRARIGGRIETLRSPFAAGLYAEAGAMRLPTSHRLTMAYVDRFGLETVPFTLTNPNCYVHLHGVRRRLAEVEAEPGLLGFDGVADTPVLAMWDAELGPLRARLASDGAWSEITDDFDGYSTREFLESRGWSEGAIECFGLLGNQEAVMNSSFLEVLREEMTDSYRDLVQIRGGMDQLPAAFLPKLGARIRFGAKMVAIGQGDSSVTIHYRTRGGRFTATGDFAVITVPFSVMRHVEVLTPLTRSKQKAIRQLTYDASAKI
ncbi:MAG TPA: NAD(P)/FAD-dependent oxidoreductase, partial [Acidimicrobiia bacterium]